MSAGRPLIRVPMGNDPWHVRHRQGELVSRSGRVLEDVSKHIAIVAAKPAAAEPQWSAPKYRDPDDWRRPPGVSGRSGPTVSHLHRAVAILTGVSREAILGLERKPRIAKARHILAWLMQKQAKRSLPSIGAYLGGRDHTSPLNGICRVRDALAAHDIDPEQDTLSLIEALWAVKWPKPTRRP